MDDRVPYYMLPAELFPRMIRSGMVVRHIIPGHNQYDMYDKELVVTKVLGRYPNWEVWLSEYDRAIVSPTKSLEGLYLDLHEEATRDAACRWICRWLMNDWFYHSDRPAWMTCIDYSTDPCHMVWALKYRIRHQKSKDLRQHMGNNQVGEVRFRNLPIGEEKDFGMEGVNLDESPFYHDIYVSGLSSHKTEKDALSHIMRALQKALPTR